MPRTKPIIGLTLDFENNGGYSNMPWYAIRENYCTSISNAGGIPLPLPHAMNCVNDYLSMLDGLVVTGGAFDVDPAMYGDTSTHETVSLKQGRTQFEMAILRGMMDAKKPILGICGGQQLLHVALGGKLIQHIPDSVPNCLPHEQPNPRTEAGHTVKLKAGTLLHRIAGNDEIPVNSAHHQAAADEPEGVIVNAVAPDGVIEGIEYPAHPFCLGVQWHPEYHISPADTAIFDALVGACK